MSWYESPYNNRHPKLKEDTVVMCATGSITLPRGTIVQPIRAKYLPRGTWVADVIWSESTHVICHKDGQGFVMVPAEAIDFSK